MIDWLAALAARHGRRIMVRLVKGAYWDAEIKHAQTRGLAGYPVYTRKASTDVAYLVCAARLLAQRERLYPQFASHNAHSAAAVLALAGSTEDFEFQRLHGMGEELYEELVEQRGVPVPVRIYAPVGVHRELLAYLVRRLLENGANSSFVHNLADAALASATLAADPRAKLRGLGHYANRGIALPPALFGADARQRARRGPARLRGAARLRRRHGRLARERGAPGQRGRPGLHSRDQSRRSPRGAGPLRARRRARHRTGRGARARGGRELGRDTGRGARRLPAPRRRPDGGCAGTNWRPSA